MAMTSEFPIEELEVDPNFGVDTDDTSSGYCTGFESDTISLLSCARAYVFENGRRYHGYKEGKYLLPNDESEQDRMDLLHHCCLMALRGKLFVAPVGEDWKPQRILDLGTGSGIWAIDMADQYPEAQVIGLDLSPIQPQLVPPNVDFVVDDVEETWAYQENSFDFVHLRNMTTFMYDLPKLYQQAFRALKPGGWIEVQDICDLFSSDDNSMPESSFLHRWKENWDKAALMSGRQPISAMDSCAKTLEDIGCVDVGVNLFKFPIGPWPKGKSEKALGMYWKQHHLDGIEAFTLAAFTRTLKWKKKDVDDFLAGYYADLRNPKYHVYSKFNCTYGRKPLV